MSEVFSRIVPSSGPSGAALWPVPWGATRRPRAQAASMVAWTSATEAARTTAVGRWSTSRCQAWRASSQCASPGRARSPLSRAASASRPASRSSTKASVSRKVVTVLSPSCLCVRGRSDEGRHAQGGGGDHVELGKVVRAGDDQDVVGAGGLLGKGLGVVAERRVDDGHAARAVRSARAGPGAVDDGVAGRELVRRADHHRPAVARGHQAAAGVPGLAADEDPAAVELAEVLVEQGAADVDVDVAGLEVVLTESDAEAEGEAAAAGAVEALRLLGEDAPVPQRAGQDVGDELDALGDRGG